MASVVYDYNQNRRYVAEAGRVIACCWSVDPVCAHAAGRIQRVDVLPRAVTKP